MDSGKYGSKSTSFFPGRSRGSTDKPNRFNVNFRDIPQEMDGARIPQGEVTTNRPFVRDLVKRRKASSAKAEPRFRIEAVMEDRQLHINEGDLLVMAVRNRTFNGGTARYVDKETHGAVMSSMRGLRIGEHDYKNPALWRASWAFGGFAKTNKQIGGVTEGSRVAASMAGGRTVRTNSIEPIYPGQIVRMEVPPLKQEDRQELVRKARANGADFDPAKPYLKPERPEDYLTYIQEHFESYLKEYVFAAGNRQKRDTFLLTDPFNPHDSDNNLDDLLRFFHVNFCRGAALDFASHLVLAEKLGLATINLTPGMTAADLANLSRAYSDISAMKLDSDLDKTIIRLTASGKLDETANANQALQTRTSRIARAKILFELLGLLPRERVDPSPELIEVIMLHGLHGLLPPNSDAEQLRQQTAITHTGPRRHTDLLDPVESRMQSLHQNNARIKHLAFYQWYSGMATHRVGKALNATPAGGEADLKF